MRRLMISILLLITLYGEGQIINASPAYRPFAPSCSYLLDQYSGAAAAYSLRKLDCDYTGYAIRVRRSSDNSEQDIGFTSAGDLDTSALLSFVSSNSGYIVTWYDQMSTYNATQSTAGNQPRIVNSGVIERLNSKPTLRFVGLSTNVRLTHTATMTGAYQIYAVQSSDNQTHYRGIYACGSSASNGFMMLSRVASTDRWGTYGAAEFSAGTSLQSAGAKLLCMDGTINSSGTFYINGASDGTYSSSSGQSVKHIGGVDNSQNYNGYISELIIFTGTPSRTSIESNINTYYSIY